MIPTPLEAEQLPGHPLIEQFASDMVNQPTPPGVRYWLLHDRYRRPERQADALARGTSNAAYGQSPHSRWSGSAAEPPWAGAAIDIYPILDVSIEYNGQTIEAGSVSPLQVHYQPIADLAAVYGLENLGTKYGWDWAHSQLTDWRDYPVLPDPDAQRLPSSTQAGPSLLAVGATVGALAYLARGLF